MYKSVIFDMDGVIFDSEQAILDLWDEMAREHNIPNIRENIMKCIGINEDATEKVLFDAYGDDFPYREYKKVISARYHEKFDGGRLPMKPYVKELLEFLTENGYRIAIASSTKSSTVIKQIEEAGIANHFQVVIGGEMVSRSKPNPDIFIKAFEELDADRDNTYVIEDSYNGIKAAFAANLKGIMVPDLLKPNDEMREKAFKIFEDLGQVKEFIENL